jgi:hypothetical protein
MASAHMISRRRWIGTPSSYSDGPSRSSNSALRSASDASSRTHAAPSASRSTVISSAAWPGRGTSSFRTAGVPSASSASAT